FICRTERYVKKKNTREHTGLHIAVDMHSFPRWHLKVIRSMVPHPTANAIRHCPAMMHDP
ncbi:hypothetical protein, partial [Cytophaga sp. FL35]|uniref:hypothetical protein n=1 Tax=Cytophaga sp. FL35 TaxID=1904456 RepID=UPI001CA38DB9